MKPISLEPVFSQLTADISALKTLLRRNRTLPELADELTAVEFNTAYDFLRSTAIEMVRRGEPTRAVEEIRELDRLLGEADNDPSSDSSHQRLDLHAALMQILTAVSIETGDFETAMASAAAALNLLAQEPRRKDEPFLEILGALLYDIAYLHADRKEFKQAERELGKSLKIYERLAKANPERYAPTHVMALNAATAIYRDRVEQAELLAHYQAATSTYLQMVNAGVEEATGRLIDSIVAEGDTLAKMGRHREAVQYYSRALKYLTKLEPQFTLRQLQLSVALGESMLRIDAMKEKGIHLLNTMLHKATKINATDVHRRIVDILYSARSSSLDILGLWHKIFPK